MYIGNHQDKNSSKQEKKNLNNRTGGHGSLLLLIQENQATQKVEPKSQGGEPQDIRTAKPNCPYLRILDGGFGRNGDKINKLIACQ